MKKVNLHEAKERLPELLDEVDKGEEVIIAKGDEAAYKITAVALETREGTERVAGAASEANPPLASLIGAGGGKSFSSAEDVDTYIRNLRDEWES